MSKVKICGLQRTQDIEIVNEFMPNYAGFILGSEKKFRRQVSASDAEKLSEKLDPQIKSVGVFVDEPIDFICSLCDNDVIDIIQLHGSEDNDYILELSKRVQNPIIKAVHVKNSNQVEQAEKLSCNYLLLDTAYKDKAGGGGKKFDWDLIPEKVSKPYFLAGGINAKNAIKAIEKLNPYCIDVSSSVETDGYKDRKKVKEIINLVRSV